MGDHRDATRLLGRWYTITCMIPLSVGAPGVSIGGAATFDGVFLTGVIAGRLA